MATNDRTGGPPAALSESSATPIDKILDAAAPTEELDTKEEISSRAHKEKKSKNIFKKLFHGNDSQKVNPSESDHHSRDLQVPENTESLEKKNHKANFIKNHCQRVDDKSQVNMYVPTMKLTFQNKPHSIRKFAIGKEKLGKSEKVIMIVGATGSGKTTLINGMFNYVTGTEWNDDFRLKLIEEEPKSQAFSVTKHITSYTIHHQEGFQVDYTLTIIDTPGFGDTSGIERDKEITEQIRQLFTTEEKGRIDQLHAVGFVTQSSLPRLTASQKYIFDSILSLFGKDMEDRIFMMLTFADAQRPPVLAGIKEAGLTFKRGFKFNNSALYICQESEPDEIDDVYDDSIAKFFWNMGMKNFRNFMTEVEKATPLSLTQTKEVLNERRQLEVSIEGIQKEIKLGLNKLDQLATEMEVLKHCKTGIDEDKTYEVTDVEYIKEPTKPGQNTTNCLKCNVTCHHSCIYSDDKDKKRCSSMTKENCHVCPSACHWTIHKNQPYVYVYKEKTRTKTAKELRTRLQGDEEDLRDMELVERCIDEFNTAQLNILLLTEETRKSVVRLEEIALRPNPLSHFDYIELLIEAEKREGKLGWKKRVKQLTNVSEKAKYLHDVTEEGFDPYEEYRKKIDEESRKGKHGIWTSLKKSASRFSNYISRKITQKK